MNLLYAVGALSPVGTIHETECHEIVKKALFNFIQVSQVVLQ